LPGDGETFAKAKALAQEQYRASSVIVVDLYLIPVPAAEPSEIADAERASYFYHKGHAAKLRGDKAAAIENFKKAAACSPGLLETRCAALEAQALESPSK
jgi:hypothetical protein